jgi:hypothetical protein
MKKISAVLLVLVLVGSVAFAAITGSAWTGVGYNLDTGAYGFISRGTSVTASASFLQMIGEKKGQGDIYADIKATLDFTWSNANAGNTTSPNGMIVTMTWNHAKIVGDGWYVGILSSLAAPNFATSVIDSSAVVNANNALGYAVSDSTVYADLRASDFVTQNAAGIQIGKDGYVGSIGLLGNSDTNTYNLYASVTTPEVEVADGMKVRVGASGRLTEASQAASLSLKAAYAAESYSASVASDLVYKDGAVKADVAVNSKFNPATVDVYYATNLYYNGVDQAVANYLSARVGVVVDQVTLTLTGKNLLNTQALSFSAKLAASKELAVTARGGYTLVGGAWNGGADVVYAAADYTAKLGGTYFSSTKLAMYASIESTKLVSGATLKLAYAGDDLTGVDAATETNGNLGKIIASATIAF